MISAFNKMIEFNRNYKDTKRIYRAMQDYYITRQQSSAVFFPSSELYPIAPIFLLERERGGLGNKIVNQMDERQISLLTYYWGLHVFGTWRNTLGVYRIDDDIFGDVMKSPIPTSTPSIIFKRLPDWCVYMQMPDDTVFIKSQNGTDVVCDGFWALIDYDYDVHTDEPYLVLNIVLNSKDKTNTAYDTYQPMRILLDESLTVSEAFEQLFIQDFNHKNARHAKQAQKDMIATKELLMKLLSALLWLCVEEPDISNIKGEPITREQIKSTGSQVNKKTGRFVPPPTPNIRFLGSRLGGEVREYRQWVAKGKPSGEQSISYKVRPHIRSGHFHGFWKGTGQNKHFDVKWQYACFVNVKL